MLLFVCKQATIKIISDALYTPLWCDTLSLSFSLSLSLSLSLTHTHTHTHAHDAQNSAFEQSIANTETNNKTYSRWFRSARLS